MSLKRTKRSATAGKSPATQSASVTVATPTGPAERKAEIGLTISNAMRDLSRKKQVDWTRETPATVSAQSSLDEAMIGFIEGTATREAVKKAYKQFADLHIVEKGTN